MSGAPDASDLDAVPALPRDAGGPVFAEPWQAQAFAMTLRLHEAGLFAWTEWVDYLSREIAAATGLEPQPDYYALWLAALEKLVADKDIAAFEEQGAMKQAWRDAYLRTPHGQPVVLDGE